MLRELKAKNNQDAPLQSPFKKLSVHKYKKKQTLKTCFKTSQQHL